MALLLTIGHGRLFKEMYKIHSEKRAMQIVKNEKKHWLVHSLVFTFLIKCYTDSPISLSEQFLFFFYGVTLLIPIPNVAPSC